MTILDDDAVRIKNGNYIKYTREILLYKLPEYANDHKLNTQLNKGKKRKLYIYIIYLINITLVIDLHKDQFELNHVT